MENESKYLFGPVPSRRLGLSLGVDIVPLKVCSLNCIYCQLGRTPKTTVERKEYVDIGEVLEELGERVARGLRADYVTISGSGEPTLNSRLGELVDGIRGVCDIPVAILTNGTLFDRADVRAECAKADVVLPSLDAGNAETFKRINRPDAHLDLGRIIEGLVAFRKEYSGPIWLEVFLVAGVNTAAEQIEAIKKAVERIGPDKIHLNTAVRPTAEEWVGRLSPEKMEAIAAKFGDRCEVIADFVAKHPEVEAAGRSEEVLSMLKRRPCSLEDVCAGLGVGKIEAGKYLSLLEQRGVISSEKRGETVFYRVK
jgi:wyosine [tRNA(Phe)-imidazoG37] synthetase (radical SAM superfamily)